MNVNCTFFLHPGTVDFSVGRSALGRSAEQDVRVAIEGDGTQLLLFMSPEQFEALRGRMNSFAEANR